MKTTHITLTRLKKSIERDEVQWVSNALMHAEQDVVNDATYFAYLNEHFACFEILAPKMSIENSYNIIKLSCEYLDLEYFKVLMSLPQQPKTLERMICYAAREDFFEGFSWSVEAFHSAIDGSKIMLEALQNGPHYVDIAYQYFPQSSDYGLNNINGFRNRMNSSPENLSVIDSSIERLKALITQTTLVNTIDLSERHRGRKI